MKKFIVPAATLILISLSLIIVILIRKESCISPLAQNVEAFASSEGVSGVIECSGDGSIYCPIDRRAAYSLVAIYQ